MTPMPTNKVAILGDYAGVALDLADWSPVRTRADVTAFDHHFSEDEAVEALQPFDVIQTPSKPWRLGWMESPFGSRTAGRCSVKFRLASRVRRFSRRSRYMPITLMATNRKVLISG